MEFPCIKYYSQINQDKNYLTYTNNKKNGYFVDIGASDGKCFSNTLTLEESYHWDGLLLEPNIVPYEVCKKTRRNKTLQLAVYNKNGEIEFYSPANNLMGGVKSDLNPVIIDIYQKEGYGWKGFNVPCKTLYTILEENNAPHLIDYMSLDTEGSEFEILECFFKENNNKYTISYLDIEHNFIQENKKKINDVLIKNGYKFLKDNSFDFTYIKN